MYTGLGFIPVVSFGVVCAENFYACLLCYESVA